MGDGPDYDYADQQEDQHRKSMNAQRIKRKKYLTDMLRDVGFGSSNKDYGMSLDSLVKHHLDAALTLITAQTKLVEINKEISV